MANFARTGNVAATRASVFARPLISFAVRGPLRALVAPPFIPLTHPLTHSQPILAENFIGRRLFKAAQLPAIFKRLMLKFESPRSGIRVQ